MTDRVAIELFQNERILWEGKPSGNTLFRWIYIKNTPCSLILLVPIAGWFAMDFTTSSDLTGKFGDALFLFLCFYLVIGRLITDYAIRRHISYFVTNRRIIIKQYPLLFKYSESVARSLTIAHLPPLGFDEQADGSGTIWFGTQDGLSNATKRRRKVWHPALDRTPQFLDVPNVRSVYELIIDQTDN